MSSSCNKVFFFFFSSRRRHTRLVRDWSSDVCSSDLELDDTDSFSPVLSVLMNRSGSAQAIASKLQQTDISSDDAKLISRWLSAAGYDDPTLINEIGRASCRERV